MTHNDMNPIGYVKLELMRGERVFVNFDAPAKVICDAGRIGAAHLAFFGEYLQDVILLPRC